MIPKLILCTSGHQWHCNVLRNNIKFSETLLSILEHNGLSVSCSTLVCVVCNMFFISFFSGGGGAGGRQGREGGTYKEKEASEIQWPLGSMFNWTTFGLYYSFFMVLGMALPGVTSCTDTPWVCYAIFLPYGRGKLYDEHKEHLYRRLTWVVTKSWSKRLRCWLERVAGYVITSSLKYRPAEKPWNDFHKQPTSRFDNPAHTDIGCLVIKLY